MLGLKRNFPYDPASYVDVWVYIEVNQGKTAQVGFELLGQARRLASSLGSDVCAVILGENIRGLAIEVFEYGADKIYLIDNPVLKHYRSDAYVGAILQLARKYKP